MGRLLLRLCKTIVGSNLCWGKVPLIYYLALIYFYLLMFGKVKRAVYLLKWMQKIVPRKFHFKRANGCSENYWKLSKKKSVVQSLFHEIKVLNQSQYFKGYIKTAASKDLSWWWIDKVDELSPSRISDTPQAGFEHAQNLISNFIEWRCSAFDVIKIITIEISFICYYFTM